MICDVALLAAPTFRSRAYAQMLVARDLTPAVALLLSGQEPKWGGAASVELSLGNDAPRFTFRPGEPVYKTLRLAGVPIVELDESDINAPPFIEVLKSQPHDVIVYSGFAGVLLRPNVLACGKRLLHVHGGYAPYYRGSTAFYYSLLRDGAIGATAMWLAKDIDAGDILARTSFAPPQGVEVDRIVDPAARAELLAHVLACKRDTGKFPRATKDHSGATTYHVIHPVLKHLALKRVGLIETADES